MDGTIAGPLGSFGTFALIAARPTLFRFGLVGILRDHQAQWPLYEADTFAEALAIPLTRAPDILLLEEHLPDLKGVDGLRQAQSAFPHVKVIVLSNTDERERILEFIDAGAHGCLTTAANPSQVLAAFNTVMCGGVFIPALIRDGAAPLPPRPALQSTISINSLTERQRAVFDLMARGYSTKLIARELGLAVGTVKVHLAAIYRLLGAHNRTEAVARVVTGGNTADRTRVVDLPVILSGVG